MLLVYQNFVRLLAMHEYKAKLEKLKEFIYKGFESQKIGEKKAQLQALNDKMAEPNFWSNKEEAQRISKEASFVQQKIEKWEKIRTDVDELIGLLPDISPEKDPDAADDFKKMVDELEMRWDKLETETFFSGKYDRMNAILSIHAGTGGTDAQDFGEMLMRMYLRYVEKPEKHGEVAWKSEILDESKGDEAGIKSVTILIKGEFAYGYLKGESGVHRLVRLSPFNAGGTRETSFVLVEVLPDISGEGFGDGGGGSVTGEGMGLGRFKIDEKDLRIDTYRSSGPGGQNVNKTDSAVRITHIPTGLVAACQNERSQLQNKMQAMKILHAKLADLMERQKIEELKDLKGEKVEMSWGNQIRSYVLHPYKMVKDHRTSYEESNPEKVLDGEIQGFVEAELKG